MAPAIKCLIVLAIVALLFITELIPLAITAMSGAIACGLLGFIPAKQVFSGLSDSTVVLFAGMFVVGAAMFHTGLAQKIGISIVRFSGTSENSLMFGIMIVGAGLSSVLSNTGTAACLMPVVLGICAAAKIPASRQLMPLAYAAGVGGIITLVGTPPNIIVSGALKSFGYEPFSFFEFAWIGIPITVVAIAYMMFIGKYFLPKAELDADQENEQEIELEDLPEGGLRIRDVTRPVLKPVHGRGGQRPVAIHIDGGNSLRPFQRIAAFLHQGQSQRRVGDAPVIILAIAHDGRYVAGAATVYLRLETRRIHDIQDDDHHDHANGQGGTEYRDHAQQLVLPDHPQRLFNVLLYHKPLYYKLSIIRPKQRLFVIIRLCAPTEANNVPKT